MNKAYYLEKKWKPKPKSLKSSSSFKALGICGLTFCLNFIFDHTTLTSGDSYHLRKLRWNLES